MNTANTTAGINHVSPPLTCEPAAVTTTGGVEDDVPVPTTAGVVVPDGVVGVPEPETAGGEELDVPEPTTAELVVSDATVEAPESETAGDVS